MTGTQYLSMLRQRLGDTAKVTYDDDELLSYLNDAVEQLSLERINARDPTMATEETVTPGTSSVPEGFVSFAGQYPVYFAGGKIEALDGTTAARTVRYFAVKPRLSDAAETVPFGDEAVHVLLNYAVTAAAARTGASAETESAIGTRGVENLQKAGTGIGRAAHG